MSSSVPSAHCRLQSWEIRPWAASTGGNHMSSEDSRPGIGVSDENAAGSRQPQAGSNDLIRFVDTKGTQVAGRHKDKFVRIAETICDLELACEGALSLARRSAKGGQGQWGAALARACSVFLRKMVVGDWNHPATRLLDEDVVRNFAIGFHRLRRIPAERRTIELRQFVHGGTMQLTKLNEDNLSPEATVSIPVAPHELNIAVEWPLPGAASWNMAPTPDLPWTISPEELFDLEAREQLDCSAWLGQQLVMFDQRGITLKDVVRMVATFEGAHSINVARLLQPADEQARGPLKNPERHILDNIVVFGMKYTHIVVIECALYLYEMLADGGHIERLDDEKWRLRPSFVTTDPTEFFSTKQDWLKFDGDLILAFGVDSRSITHEIRPVGT